jgi:heme A synthase
MKGLGMQQTKFARYAWGVLGLNILVILWGAFVRATGSGAGCGSHWPLCNGEVIPVAAQVETLVEFAHRITSGLALLAVLLLFVWGRRLYPRGATARLGVNLSLFFIITEALVGAGLVLFGWTANDDSLGRAISIVVHLVNTFLLLASLSLTAWWASGYASGRFERGSGLFLPLGLGLLGALLMGASGALTALGDTLFPSGTLAEGLSRDFSPTAHFLERLRVLHPVLAVLVSVSLIALAYFHNFKSYGATSARLARLLIGLLLVQLAAGLVNVLLLAPVWMQIVHLLLADSVWIALVLLSATTLSVPSEQAARAQSGAPADQHRSAAVR